MPACSARSIRRATWVVMLGAFTQTLQHRGLRKIPMFQRDPSEPVGIRLELREDIRGLWARGRSSRMSCGDAS